MKGAEICLALQDVRCKAVQQVVILEYVVVETEIEPFDECALEGQVVSNSPQTSGG